MGIRKVAHAELAVGDVERVLDFHVAVLGLAELGRENGAVYLGCGLDKNYDLALTTGGTGVRSFALEVESQDDIKRYGERLAHAGVETETRTDDGPGAVESLRFRAPSGHLIDLVYSGDRPLYLHPARAHYPRHQGIGPIDADHITLRAEDPKALADFLVSVLDFKVSDVILLGPDVWGGAWTRVGEFHHDVAIVASQAKEETLDHFAWTFDGIDHVKRAADALANSDIGLEAGPGRHGVGGNLYTYFQAPGGNRYELSAEMPRTTRADEGPRFWNGFGKAFSAWGQPMPESLYRGS